MTTYAPGSPGARAYVDLAREVLERKARGYHFEVAWEEPMGAAAAAPQLGNNG